jgi:hypothetical protein
MCVSAQGYARPQETESCLLTTERPQNINQPTISQNDLECLEHLRNVGQLVGDLMQVQDCTTVRRDRRSSYSSPP